MGRRLLVVALTSTTLLGLEILWTRLFSAEFFYAFAFLTLSLAVAGLGLGALCLRFVPALAHERHLPWMLFLSGFCAVAGPPLVFRLGVDFAVLFSSFDMALRFLATVGILASAYFFGGMALALIFRSYSSHITSLYMADLLGAAAGVLLAVVTMNQLGTPTTAFCVGLPILVAAAVASPGWRALMVVPFLVFLVAYAGSAPDLLRRPREERAPVIYEHWDAMAKIKMFAFGGGYRGLNIDNLANSPVLPFEGTWEEWELEEVDWDIDVGHLVAQFDSCRFLSLGAGGGSDVFQALNHGAASIAAVEVNPHINRMLLEGDPAGYTVLDSTNTDSLGNLVTCAQLTGHVYKHPRVQVFSEDARSFVRRHRGEFDVIYSLSSNTWASLASGSFALAESYLFTTEAFIDYWNALSESGFLSMEHQVYMPRLVSQVMDALRTLGVAEPTSHFAVYELPKLRRKLLLLSRQPLTDDLRRHAYGELTPEHQEHIRLIHPAPDSLRGNLIDRIVREGWESQVDSVEIDLSPCTDDRPFVAQMGRWDNLSRGRLENVRWLAEFRGFPLAKLMIVIILAVVTTLVLPLTLLPYLKRGPRLRPTAWLYFFAIGMAFMMVEIVLIQKYTLFIGASVYSLVTVLFTLLLASGLGSFCARQVSGKVVFGAILLLLVLETFALRPVTAALSGWALPLRIAATGLVVFPLGFFMGMPFPKAGLRVGALIDWGFAVNGAASVLGSTLVVLIAITQGFTAALLVGGAFYMGAALLFSARRTW